MQHGVCGAAMVAVRATSVEHVAADAACQAHAPAVAVNHSAVAAGKRQQWHQVGRQIAIDENAP